MRYTLLMAVFIGLLFACKNKSDAYATPENALDAGRSFIEHSLKGKFNNAKRYMLADEENDYWLAKWSEKFSRYSEQEKTGFSSASINILEITDVVPDSVTIIHFTNSYKNVPQKLKVIKHQQKWMVDFKYTFSGNL